MSEVSGPGLDERMVPIDKVKPNNWNPNQMPPEIFKQLGEEIEVDGLDQRIVVVEAVDEDGNDYFKIIDGEHRYRQAVIQKHDNLPIVVKPPMSEEEMKIKTVRRNMIKGDQSNARLRDLIMEMSGEKEKQKTLLAHMAIQRRRINEIVREEVEIERPEQSRDARLRTFKDASALLQELIDDGGYFGEGVCVFSYDGKQINVISLDDSLNEKMSVLASQVAEKGGSIAKTLSYVLETLIEMHDDGASVPENYDPKNTPAY